MALCNAAWLARVVGTICPWDRVVVWLARHEAQVYTPVDWADPQANKSLSGWTMVTQSRASILEEENKSSLHIGSVVPLQAQQDAAVLLEPVACRAAKACPGIPMVRRWLVDTGSAHDIVRDSAIRCGNRSL